MPDAKLKTGWTRVAFGDVVKLNRETCKDPLGEGIERFVGLEHIDSEDLKIRRWGNVADGITFTNRFKPGQVLFGKRRSYLRKVAVAEFDGICSGDIYVFEAKPKHLLPELLPFICQTDAFFDYAIGTSAGSMSPRTNWKSLANYEFALPPIDEQRRMAEVFSHIQRSSALYETCIEAKRLAQTAYMDGFFRRTDLQRVPIRGIGRWLSGGTPPRSNKELWDGNYPWVSPKDMKTALIGDSEEKTTKEAALRHSKVVPDQTILIVVRGMILAHTFPVGFTIREVCFNQDIKALLVDPKSFHPKYVFFWFTWAASQFLRLVSESSHGTKRLETDVLTELRIPVANLDEQGRVVNRLEELTNAEYAISARRQVANLLMKNFAHGCFGLES